MTITQEALLLPTSRVVFLVDQGVVAVLSYAELSLYFIVVGHMGHQVV